MKITNFNKGNYQYIGTGSEVYYGKIEMTLKEYTEVIKYLNRAKNTGFRDLNKDTKNKQEFKNGFDVGLGVSRTEQIFKKYNLPRYKRQNYYLSVITK
mgnify:CR=1 FL=1